MHARKDAMLGNWWTSQAGTKLYAIANPHALDVNSDQNLKQSVISSGSCTLMLLPTKAKGMNAKNTYRLKGARRLQKGTKKSFGMEKSIWKQERDKERSEKEGTYQLVELS